MRTRKKRYTTRSKEPISGKVLAIDPASRACGVALFESDGTLIDTWSLTTDGDTWGDRLCDLACQFAESSVPFEEVTEIAIECLKGASNSPMLNSISGIFIQFLPNAKLKTSSFITPSAWKGYIRKVTGEKSPLPKGYESLKLYDSSYPAMSEDEADSVMIGLTYISKRK